MVSLKLLHQKRRHNLLIEKHPLTNCNWHLRKLGQASWDSVHWLNPPLWCLQWFDPLSSLLFACHLTLDNSLYIEITKISMSFGMGYSIIVEFIQSGATPDSKMAMTLFWSLFVPVVILVLFGVIELLKIKGKAQDLKEKVGGGVEKESLVQHVPDESVDAGNGSDANP
eukprot:497261_1